MHLRENEYELNERNIEEIILEIKRRQEKAEINSRTSRKEHARRYISYWLEEYTNGRRYVGTEEIIKVIEEYAGYLNEED